MSLGKIVCSCVLLVMLAADGAAQNVRRTILDVPFVAQSEALCGGAAAAMVLRYWGTGSVYAEDFAPLVDESAEGIRLNELSRAITERGWRAAPFSATTADVQGHLARGRPIIALIEDRPGRYHYVVVVAWTSDRVVLHDPAHGPFRVMDVARFERAWAVTERTALLVLPAADTAGVPASTEAPAPEQAANTCSEPLQQAVRLAREGDLSNAETLMLLVRQTCPGTGAAERELAGIRFLQRRWAEAASLASEAVAREPSDMHAWQLVAASRFLDGDQAGALVAWNRRQEPRVDLAKVEGLDRIPHNVVASLLDLAPEDVLTDRKLARAARRVSMLPALQTSRVGYTPQADGRATVDVAVLERPVVPRRWQTFAAMGLHSAVAREVRLESANATSNGELWTASWRWWANRPRVAIGVAAPKFLTATGLWRIEGSWERQRYLGAHAPDTASPDGLITSERRRASVSFRDWASGDLQWEVVGALDRWANRGSHAAAGAAVEQRLAADRIALGAEGTLWRQIGGTGAAFASGSLSAAWRSTAERGHSWAVAAGLYGVSAGAPFDLWPSVGTGHGRPLLLRAHPLLHDGTIRLNDLARVLAHGTLERKQRLATRSPAPLWWAAFVDVAKRATPAEGPAGSMSIDIGTGLRLDLPGTPNVLRLDIARGLRDGNTALSIGWQPAWPHW